MVYYAKKVLAMQKWQADEFLAAKITVVEFYLQNLFCDKHFIFVLILK